jgi:hypothetical protein
VLGAGSHDAGSRLPRHGSCETRPPPVGRSTWVPRPALASKRQAQNNTFANYAGAAAACPACIRPMPAILVKICANKTGSGFSGSIVIVSVTSLSARNRAFKSRRLQAGSLWRPSCRTWYDTLTMNKDRCAAFVTAVSVTFMKSAKPQYCLASRTLNSIWKRRLS